VFKFSWLDANGQVSEYVANCATLAMSVIDLKGSLVDNVNHSYTKLSTNGKQLSLSFKRGQKFKDW